MKKIIVIAIIFFLGYLVHHLYADDDLKQFNPPLTKEELTIYEGVKVEFPGRLQQFVETRKYFRKIKSLFPNFNFDADIKKVPEPNRQVKFIFCITDEEVTLLVYIKAEVAKRKRGEK